MSGRSSDPLEYDEQPDPPSDEALAVLANQLLSQDPHEGPTSLGLDPQAPQPDEWNRLDLHAELERIERNLKTWRSLAPTRLVEDHETLLVVLRRADSVIHAQAHDLRTLREELAGYQLTPEQIAEAIEENTPTPVSMPLRRKPLTLLDPDEVLL